MYSTGQLIALLRYTLQYSYVQYRTVNCITEIYITVQLYTVQDSTLNY